MPGGLVRLSVRLPLQFAKPTISRQSFFGGRPITAGVARHRVARLAACAHMLDVAASSRPPNRYGEVRADARGLRGGE